jgi:hypothetical protein
MGHHSSRGQAQRTPPKPKTVPAVHATSTPNAAQATAVKAFSKLNPDRISAIAVHGCSRRLEKGLATLSACPFATSTYSVELGTTVGIPIRQPLSRTRASAQVTTPQRRVTVRSLTGKPRLPTSFSRCLSTGPAATHRSSGVRETSQCSGLPPLKSTTATPYYRSGMAKLTATESAGRRLRPCFPYQRNEN